MLEQYCRTQFQAYCVDPFLDVLEDIMTPIQLTYLAIIMGVIAIPLIAYQFKVIATILLLVSGFLDIVDGSLARNNGTSSDYGAVLDIVADRIVEFSALFGIYLVAPIQRSTLTILMLGSVLICITSFLVVAIVSDNQSEKSFYYSPGLMERAEAFIFFILMIWLPQYFSFLSMSFIVLVSYTALKRVYDYSVQI